MDKLEKKYKTGDITSEELLSLRSSVMSMSDELLEKRMYDDWQSESVDDGHVVDERLVVVKERIDRQLFGDDVRALHTEADIAEARPVKKLHIPWGWIAAAVMVPFFMLTTFYFYRSSAAMESGAAVFATAEGQQAGVTLPDGTVVTMNAGSSLSYAPVEFNTRKRNVEFSGEAYFDVSKNKDVPFFIHSGDMIVKVLGTKFNLEAYPELAKATLALDEGIVEISSGKETCMLKAGQVATLDYSDGSISVVSGECVADASAWMKSELMFHGITLDEVVAQIEHTYGVKIHLDNSVSDDDTFTGNIPTNNLVDALEIVKISYGLDYRIESKEIYFCKD